VSGSVRSRGGVEPRVVSALNSNSIEAERSPALHGVSVVIPAKNEARNIGWVLRRLPEVDEVIIVDGQSTDGTIAVARGVIPGLRLVEESRPGKGAALRAGFAAARGDFVVMLDADGSMDPAEISQYVAALQSGYDLAKGSRFAAGGGSADISRLRRAGNGGLLMLANLLYGARFTDLCYGFMAFRRSCLDDMALAADGFEIETEIVVNSLRAKLRVGEVPSFESPRRYGTSNLNTFRDGQRVLRTMVKARLARRRRRQVERLADRAADGAPAPAAAGLPLVRGRFGLSVVTLGLTAVPMAVLGLRALGLH
jgi:glycosyltransferase involved in cell wall biosynthesis